MRIIDMAYYTFNQVTQIDEAIEAFRSRMHCVVDMAINMAHESAQISLDSCLLELTDSGTYLRQLTSLKTQMTVTPTLTNVTNKK